MSTKDWIRCGKTWRSMRTSDSIKAGMQLEIKDANTKQLMLNLVGEINELGRSCDDCSYINNDDVVVRYRVIVDESELTGR